MEMKKMKKFLIAAVCFSCLCPLRGASYGELMTQADNLVKAKKYQEAAAAFDNASLETGIDQERMEAKYRCWKCLKTARAANAVSFAESLLYDETELSNDRKIELVSYLADTLSGDQDKRAKVLEYGLKLKNLDEKQRSRVLLAALNVSGTFDTEAYVDEILNMKTPDPEAKANALGHRANVFLWVKRDPASALKCVNAALAIRELNEENRQFYSLVKARTHMALKQFAAAERSYLSAIRIGKQRDFQDAAYKELIQLYAAAKQGQKIEPLLKRAENDKKLNSKQRQTFTSILSEIEKTRKQRQIGK